MKIAKEKADLKKTILAIVTMLLGVVCVDLYLVVIRLIGSDYSVLKLAVFEKLFELNKLDQPRVILDGFKLVIFSPAPYKGK